MTHTDLLKGLVGAGIKWRYGEKPDNLTKRRIVWEMMQIIKAGYVDYYLMAFWIFIHSSREINYWARGAVSSSIICYCLGLTEIDPMKYGLHSERFVNDEPPMFQFDIESSCLDEFKKKAAEVFAANEENFDIQAIKDSLFQHLFAKTGMYKRSEQEIPDDFDDEIVCFALYFPATINLFESYSLRKEGHEKWEPTGIKQLDKILSPTYGILAYQEQMLDILRELFHVRAIKANRIRIYIQRGDTEQIEAYKADLFTNLKDLTAEEAERVWSVLVSNRKAFLKAHAVSRVIEKYNFKSIDNN